jgi:hypothetical protein
MEIKGNCNAGGQSMYGPFSDKIRALCSVKESE